MGGWSLGGESGALLKASSSIWRWDSGDEDEGYN